jgi:pimeloyl-ACP methyl ester carboxylesterase
MSHAGFTTPDIADAAGRVEYQESGSGQAVVFVPGSFSTGASWRAVSTPLSERHRTVSTSLCGYGKTSERRQADGFNIHHEMDVLEAVLARVGTPAHIVAHSFGAYVALYLVLCRSPRVLSLTLFEPVTFNLLDVDHDAELKIQVDAMTSQYMADWKNGDRQAVRHVIDFYGGAGTFDAYPAAVQDKLIACTDTNILDWQSPYAASFSATDLARVNVPTVVVCGGTSHAAMKRCNQLLVQHLPRAQLEILDGANHFMIVTHPSDVGRVVQDHIRSVQTDGSVV